MLVHLVLAAALALAATHLAPALLESQVPSTTPPMSTVTLAVPDPDANAGEPGRCPPANAQPLYRDLSAMALIPPASPIMVENPGPHP